MKNQVMRIIGLCLLLLVLWPNGGRRRRGDHVERERRESRDRGVSAHQRERPRRSPHVCDGARRRPRRGEYHRSPLAAVRLRRRGTGPRRRMPPSPLRPVTCWSRSSRRCRNRRSAWRTASRTANGCMRPRSRDTGRTCQDNGHRGGAGRRGGHRRAARRRRIR